MKIKPSKASILLSISLVLPMFLFAAILRWPDVRGSYLLNADSLVTGTGTIVSSHVYSETRRGRTSYYYSINYRFNVGEETFRSDQVTFSFKGTENRKFADSYVNKYPVGHTVTVFYDHNNPSFSVLEPSEKDGDLAILLVGILVSGGALILGLLSLFRQIHLRRAG